MNLPYSKTVLYGYLSSSNTEFDQIPFEALIVGNPLIITAIVILIFLFALLILRKFIKYIFTKRSLAKNRDIARIFSERVLPAERDGGESLDQYGVLLLSAGEMDASLSNFAQAVAVGNLAAHYNIGQLFIKRGDINNAIPFLIFAAQEDHIESIRLLSEIGRNSDTVSEIEYLRKGSYLEDSESMVRLAKYLTLEGNSREARLWYQRASELSNAEANFQMGKLELSAGNMREGFDFIKLGGDLGNNEAIKWLKNNSKKKNMKFNESK